VPEPGNTALFPVSVNVTRRFLTVNVLFVIAGRY
jgi:hypothetical protein